jgi:hypothetical protein
VEVTVLNADETLRNAKTANYSRCCPVGFDDLTAACDLAASKVARCTSFVQVSALMGALPVI